MEGTLKDQCKKYLGIKPYDSDTNVVKYDIYFLIQLQTTYGENAVNKTICEVIGETLKDSTKELI